MKDVPSEKNALIVAQEHLWKEHPPSHKAAREQQEEIPHLLGKIKTFKENLSRVKNLEVTMQLVNPATPASQVDGNDSDNSLDGYALWLEILGVLLSDDPVVQKKKKN